MSCWVVPSLAAELWGVSVEQVWQHMADGHVPVQNELGFDLVDVAPNSPRQASASSDRAADSSGEGSVDVCFSDALAVTSRPRSPERMTNGCISNRSTKSALLTADVVRATSADTERSCLVADKSTSAADFDWRSVRKTAGAQRRPPALRVINL